MARQNPYQYEIWKEVWGCHHRCRKTHAEAIAECQEITGLGDTWCNEANRFDSLRPDEGRKQHGIVELLQDMELLRDYDYDAVRLSIQQTNNRALIVYKTDTALNMRTVAAIRAQNMDNLAIFQGPNREPRPAEQAVQDPHRFAREGIMGETGKKSWKLKDSRPKSAS
jgi:hypothetical protein